MCVFAATASFMLCLNQGEIKQVGEEVIDLEKTYKVKKKTLDLLPEAEANIEKLRAIAANSTKNLMTLAEQWETYRAPLVKKYRRRKQLLQDSMFLMF